MRTASAYTNRVRFQTDARNVKVQYPGGVSNTYRPGLAGVCAKTAGVFIPVEYIIPCCKPKPIIICPACAVEITTYDSGTGACDITLDGTVGDAVNSVGIVLDGGSNL
jgi:hypothetical protein